MNATETVRIYTRDEQMDSLRRITENAGDWIGQRPLARLVWQSANGMITDQVMDDSFNRDAAALKGVPLAAVYNRIRRILGLIK